MKIYKLLAAFLLLSPLSQIAKADLCMDPTTHGYVTCAAPTDASGSAVLSNKTIAYGSNTITGMGTYVQCTGTFATDDALLSAAKTVGGKIIVLGACTISAKITYNSNTFWDLSGAVFTPAAAGNWSGASIKAAFEAASSATHLGIHGGTFHWEAADGTSHILSFPAANVDFEVSGVNCIGGGDCVAMTGASYGRVHDNNATTSLNACWDGWGGANHITIHNNSCGLTATAASAYCILITGFNTDNSPSNTDYFNIHDNICDINGQAVAGQIGDWIEGHATLGSASHGQIHDEHFFVAAGKWANPIRGTGVIDDWDIHDNIIVSDGVTTSSLPAIEINGSGPTRIYIHDNHVFNWVGQVAGNDQGVFKNGGTGGSLINNSCTGTCSAVLDYVGGAGTPQQLGDSAAGNASYAIASPLSLSAALTSTLATGSAPLVVASTTNVANLNASSLSGATFAAPGPIGSGTPSTGAFTSVNASAEVGNIPVNLFNWGIPVAIPPSGFFADNGVYVIGQVPSSSATLSLSGTSGSVTATFSAATLLGTAADVGRVITVLDTTYKYCTITAQSSSTVATCTISGGSWSGTGPFTNASLKLSGTPTTNTTAFSVPFNAVYPNIYLNFPVNVISASTAAGIYYAVCQSTTVCTVKNNALASGLPTIPVSPTAFAVTGTGAFSQATSALTLLTLSVPANSLGINGSLVWDLAGNRNSNTDTIALQTFYGGTQTAQLSVVSVVWYGLHRTMRNIGLTNSQIVYCATCNAAGTDATTNNNTTSALAIDSTSAQNFVLKAVLTTAATDWYIELGGTVQANYAP